MKNRICPASVFSLNFQRSLGGRILVMQGICWCCFGVSGWVGCLWGRTMKLAASFSFFFSLLEKKIYSCYLPLQAFWHACRRNLCCGDVFILTPNMAVVHCGRGFQLKQYVCGAVDGTVGALRGRNDCKGEIKGNALRIPTFLCFSHSFEATWSCRLRTKLDMKVVDLCLKLSWNFSVELLAWNEGVVRTRPFPPVSSLQWVCNCWHFPSQKSSGTDTIWLWVQS